MLKMTQKDILQGGILLLLFMQWSLRNHMTTKSKNIKYSRRGPGSINRFSERFNALRRYFFVKGNLDQLENISQNIKYRACSKQVLIIITN